MSGVEELSQSYDWFGMWTIRQIRVGMNTKYCGANVGLHVGCGYSCVADRQTYVFSPVAIDRHMHEETSKLLNLYWAVPLVNQSNAKR